MNGELEMKRAEAVQPVIHLEQLKGNHRNISEDSRDHHKWIVFCHLQ
jgi:hypothetical protein